MMRQLRESTKIIMVVVAVAFVSLMVFDWAMDLTGRSASGSPGVIGSVNGRDISLEDYQRNYQNLVEQAREQSPQGTLSDDQLLALQDQAWDIAVTAALLREERERRGIRVSNEEVLQYIRTTPPPEMRDSPAFQTDGSFDFAKYQQALADPQLASTWAIYEENVRQELPLRKLQEQVIAGVAVTDRELEEAFRAANEQVRVDYLYLDPGVLVPDSAVQVSDEELRAAYEERKQEAYARKASARITAAKWEAGTTAADTARVKVEMDSLYARAAAGEEFADLARDYSQDPGSAARGGDLGFFGRGQMVLEFDRAAFALEQDQISEPFLSPFGWHIVKAGERQKDESGAERLRASHILLPIEPSEETFAALEDSAAAFADRTLAQPDSFQRLAEQAGLEVEATPPFEQSPFVPGLGQVPEVSEWVFDNAAGSISEPIRSGAFVYVVKVEERAPAGFVPFETVKDELRRQVLFDKKLEKSRGLEERATQLVRERGLAEAAGELGLQVAQAGPFTRAAELPQIGGGNAFVGTAFGVEEGEAAGPIELENGVYYLTVTEHKPADMALFDEQRAGFRKQLIDQKSREVLEAWFQALRAEAEIEDFRDDFLQTAEGDTLPATPTAPPLF